MLSKELSFSTRQQIHWKESREREKEYSFNNKNYNRDKRFVKSDDKGN
jgi:hypothetical protein